MSDNSEKILEDISRKLNALLALTLQIIADTKQSGNQRRKKRARGELVRYFGRLGLDAKDIAAILGAPLQSVRTFLTPKMRSKQDATSAA